MDEQASATDLIDQALVPLSRHLKAAGFSKSGRNYYKRKGEVTIAVSAIASSLNGSLYAQFGLELGVAIPSVSEKIGMPLPNNVRRASQCTWATDIGFVNPEKRQKWWELRNEYSPEEAGEEVVSNIEQFGLPWLEEVSSEAGFLGWVKTQRGLPAAETLWRVGMKKEARGCIEASLEDAWISNSSSSSNRLKTWLEEHPA